MGLNKTKKHLLSKTFLILAGLAIALDMGFTLLGQSEYYWLNYSRVNEANPFAHYLLSTHPGLFIAAILLYFLFCMSLVYLLKSPWDIMLASTLFLWHSLGSSSWVKIILTKIFKNLPWPTYTSWYLPIIYLTLLGILSGFMISRKTKQDV